MPIKPARSVCLGAAVVVALGSAVAALSLTDKPTTASADRDREPSALASATAIAQPVDLASPASPSAAPSASAARTTPVATRPTKSGSGSSSSKQGHATQSPIAYLSRPPSVSGVLVNWTIAGTGTLESQSGDKACFDFPVKIDDVQGGDITSFTLTVTWPMPPDSAGPASGSGGRTPVSIHNGQSRTTTVGMCLSPVADVTLSGSPQMVASLTYYGHLANGATSQPAGIEDFSQ
jgi:hypothetical protein